MRRSAALFALVLFISLAVLAGAAPPRSEAAAAGPVARASVRDARGPHPPPPAITWTFAVYVNADNDLYTTWVQYGFPALKRVPASSEVRVVAMVDEPGATGTTLYELGDGTATVVATFPEQDFGDGATFQWFLEEIGVRYPSANLGVTVYDHGYGWRYFSRDATSHDDEITMPEANAAIVGAGQMIDVLGFDCCNMADVAVIYEMAQTGLVGYVVGSEEETEDDFPYDIQLGAVIDDPSRSPEQVAGDMVDGYARYYLPRHCFNYVTLGAIDVAEIGAAKDDFEAWVARLQLGLPLYRTRYQADLNECIYAFVSWQVDLRDFCDELIADPLIDDPTLKALSAQVSQHCADATVDLWAGSWSGEFKGLTIWWGAGSDWTAYRAAHEAQVAFGKPAPVGVGWHDFLVAVNGGAWPSQMPDTLLDRDKYGLADITFLDAQHGWAVGHDCFAGAPYMFSTADGGATWTAQTNAKWDSYGFGAIENVGANDVWAVGGQEWPTMEGTDSILLNSTDAGAKWAKQAPGTKMWLASVDFTDAQNGWVCGTNGTLLRTVNGGATWAAAPTWSGSDKVDFWSVDFTDAQNGWIVGGDPAKMLGFVRRTTDGGATWMRQQTVEARHKRRPTTQAVTGRLFFDIEAPYCAVGGDPASGLGFGYHSAYGGRSWSRSTGIPSDTCLYAVTSSPSGAWCWAVGTQGTVLRSGNGGASWSACTSPPTTRDLTGVFFSSDTDGWVVGDCDGVYSTNDGGASWSVTVIP